MPTKTTDKTWAPAVRIIYFLVFGSGFAALVYQVLWMKQLGLLFGNTSHAAAATLAAFFAGLAGGSWFWGRRVAKAGNPLRTYAWLQSGIAATALLYFLILHLYFAIYPAVYQDLEPGALLQLVKFLLALLLVFPPAFCMGGTIPVIGHYLIRTPTRFGTTSAFLYGINTLGAALGAFLAGFYLPLWVGYTKTCILAMAVTGLVALTAFLLSRRPFPRRRGEPAEKASQKGKKQARGETQSAVSGENAQKKDGRWAVSVICFLSGFGILALEVLWTRMFAQVLENSVYTFATILVLVLLCLAGGAFISSRLARLSIPPTFLLGFLLLIGAVAVTATPYIFLGLTDNLNIIATKKSWAFYILLIFKTGILTVGPPALLLGTVFPFLMKTEERYSVSAGRSLGRLAAINTAGAILGSLLCGFVMLELLGMWRTMQVLAIMYFIGAMILPLAWGRRGIALKIAGGVMILIQLFVLDPGRLPVAKVDTGKGEEKLIETWEGSDCTVTVVENQHGVAIKVNSHYSLGSTGAYVQEKLQADIPLFLRPETESIFFLGTGTGITAGSALDPQFKRVDRVIACELVPEVVTAARKYMTDVDGKDFTNGLFQDPRARVLVEDGRHYLMATDQTFDLINADLFVPFRSGAGSLYTLEHFQSAKKRLKPGGMFVQWLPLYQLTENEFSIIARTMLEVFPQVSIWRNNFQPAGEVVALVGHRDQTPFPGTNLDLQADKVYAVMGKDHRDLFNLMLPLFNPQTILFFYCGNLTPARSLFAQYPVNTDDRPLIEYLAPRTFRSKTDTALPWYVGPRIVRLIEKVQQICPPDQDPLLANRTQANRRLPLAGTAFHWARIYQVAGNEQKCHEYWQEFLRHWTNQSPAGPSGGHTDQ